MDTRNDAADTTEETVHTPRAAPAQGDASVADAATIARRLRSKLNNADHALGMRHMRATFDRQGHLVEFQDHRGEEHFRSSHIDRMPGVLRAVARGHAGMLQRSASDLAGCDNSSLDENLITAAPLCMELLRPGDGAGEVMLATTAAASYAMASRAAGLVNAAISSGLNESRAKIAKDLSKTFASLNRGTAVALTALERVRALKRDWSRELQLVQRGEGEDAVVEVVGDRH